MLDGKARQLIDPSINSFAQRLAKWGLTPNLVTFAGFAIGMLAFVLICLGQLLLAMVVLLISRIADGLDGALARHTNSQSDFGGFLDITLDFAFYGAIPLGFAIYDPASNAVAAAVLITSFYINGASFLAYAIMAQKNDIQDSPRGNKALFYTTGLAEATETIAVFCAFCLFPTYFAAISYVFAAVVFYTAFSRIMLARHSF